MYSCRCRALSNKKKVTSPNCEIYGKLDDVDNILVECAKYRRVRELLMQKINMNSYNGFAFLNILAELLSKAARFLVDMILHQ